METTLRTKTITAAERSAILSSCCGFLGEVTLTDSAIIILFAGMLGAGDMLSLLTTSVLPFFNGLCIIPMAYLVMHFGRRRLILTACASASIAYFAAVAAPFFGEWKVAVLIGSIVWFGFSLTGFIAGWFPMLDTFLTRERRTGFFSRMRFCHQLTATVFLFLISLLIGRNPSIGTLQGILFIAAVIFCGRGFFIARIPEFPGQKKESFGFRDGLLQAIGNKSLTGFSLYLFMLNLASSGTIPLMLLSLKNEFHAPDNIVVLISALSLLGMLLGYMGVGMLLRRLRLKRTFLLFHALLFLGNLILFFSGEGSSGIYLLIAILIPIYSFVLAAGTILASAEMMELATPGNKVMAMAFSGAFSYGATGLSRLFSSLLLGSGMLAAEWHIGAIRICRYQTLLLIYTATLLFAGIFLILVPAVFPHGEYCYQEH